MISDALSERRVKIALCLSALGQHQFACCCCECCLRAQMKNADVWRLGGAILYQSLQSCLSSVLIAIACQFTSVCLFAEASGRSPRNIFIYFLWIRYPISNYRSVGHIRTCYVSPRLHMPTDYGVTAKKFGYVTFRKDIICARRFDFFSRYVTQRRHMPTSILCAVTRCCFSIAEAIMQTLLDAFSAANLTLLASCVFLICLSSASVQSLMGFMNFNSEQLALAANFWWPTFA